MADARDKRTEHVNAYITPGLHALLTAQASAEQRSISFIIERALLEHLSTEEAEYARDQGSLREANVAAFGPDVIGLDLAGLSAADVNRHLAEAERRAAVLQR